MDVERLIALGGGLSELADISSIVVQRRGEGATFELEAKMSSEVQPGDVVTVGELEPTAEITEYYYLEGEVRSPGRYEYSNGLTVEMAIAIAGGFGLRASQRKISISRGGGEKDLERVALELQVQPGDVITIGTSLF